MDIIKMLDILSATMTVICLNLTVRTYKAWAWYSLSCIFFTIVTYNRNLPGLTIMGIILFVTGVKNYITGRKKNVQEKKKG